MSLLVEQHRAFIRRLYELPSESLESLLSEHLRLNAIYWALIALFLLNHPDDLPRQEVLDFVAKCQNTDGGYGASPGHDSHVIPTLHAIQIQVLLQHSVEVDPIRRFIKPLIDGGQIKGDKWGEKDQRLTYAAIQILTLCSSMDLIDVDAVRTYTLSCRNFDGGFGGSKHSESHGSHLFTSLGILSLLPGDIGLSDEEVIQTASWISDRQVPSGGLNGRPEKLPDVCYSWYLLSSLSILHREHYIDKVKLRTYIFSSQAISGGIADRPGDVEDINHTCFGIAALSLIGLDGLSPIDARFCMPKDVLSRIGIN